jgi:site-specific recombinase XerD
VKSLIRDYSEANAELVESFARYMTTRGWSPHTLRKYRQRVAEFVELMAARSVVSADRTDVSAFLQQKIVIGAGPVTLNCYGNSLRAFFKFLSLAGLIKNNPMALVGHRKLPTRLPRVLTIEEVERIIAAARNPVERGIVEVLYATGARVSELCAMRLENIISAERMILIEKGKGGKDRYVLYGKHAEKAIAEYLAWRPSKAGYLFEVAPRYGQIYAVGKRWEAQFYVKGGRRHKISIGKIADLPTEADAREAFEKILSHMNVSRPALDKGQGPYRPKSINDMLHKIAHRANVEGVHAHGFRRSMACHMLANGADIRAIQELLGHSNLSTTQIYTTLTIEKLQEIHAKCHPTAKGQTNETQKE